MDWAIALIALTAMEIVLGIDNIVFIAILAGKLPEDQQAKARRIGLGAALVTRVLLLLSLSWILSLTEPIFTLTDFGVPESWVSQEDHPTDSSSHAEAADSEKPKKKYLISKSMNETSVRDLILLFGGLFLIGKSVHEIHVKIEGTGHQKDVKKDVSFTSVIIQIAILDIVFSLDSVITAVGMAEELWVMITAVILAVIVMLVFAEKVSAFVDQHPTVKMLALSFLILIGVMLVAEGIGTHMSKGYIYFAMTFSLIVEFLNMKIRKPVFIAEDD